MKRPHVCTCGDCSPDAYKDRCDYEAKLTSALELLEDVRAYLDNEADVSDGPDGPVPDRAMQLLSRVQECIQKAGG